MEERREFRKLLKINILAAVAFGVLVLMLGSIPMIHTAFDTVPMLLIYYMIRLYTDDHKGIMPLGIGVTWGAVRFAQVIFGSNIFGADNDSFIGKVAEFMVAYPVDVFACFAGLFMMYLFNNYEKYARNEAYTPPLREVSNVTILAAMLFVPPLGIPMFMLKCLDVKDKKGRHSIFGSTIALLILQFMTFCAGLLLNQMQYFTIADKLNH